MGLFDKKFCDICGGKIGLLGNRKLSDGNLCKECAGKLSPWFSERKQSSVEDIRGQLEYREQNRAAVAAFHTTRTLGMNTRVLLDEDNRKFMVTGAKNLAEANPDVMDYSQITGCVVDIKESRTEITHRDKDGHEISFNPPQYKYSYDFYMVISVNHPYFNEIRFKLNNTSIAVQPAMRTAGMGMNPGMGGRPGMPGQPPRPGMGGRPGMPGQPPRPGMGAQNMGMMGSTAVDPTSSPEYCRYQQMSEEIRTALLGVHDEARAYAEAANAPVMAVTCPCCGATTMPDANGCCEYCGGALNG